MSRKITAKTHIQFDRQIYNCGRLSGSMAGILVGLACLSLSGKGLFHEEFSLVGNLSDVDKSAFYELCNSRVS